MEPFTLFGLVDRAARERPAAVAVRSLEGSATYAELRTSAQRVAELLVSLGVAPGDRVALYQRKSVAAVAQLLGIMEAGASYVPIDPSSPPERARFILERCGAKVLFSAGRPLSLLLRDGVALVPRLVAPRGEEAAELPAGAITLEALASGGPGAGTPLPRVTDRELAYILYTSGSTGAPKGVAISHAQSLVFVRSATEVFRLGPGDVVASHAPFNFDLSVIDLFCTFAAGGTMVVLPEPWLPFPARISRLLAETGVTVWNSVPSALIQLTRSGAIASHDLSRLRLVMFAGEPYPPKHLRTLRAALPHARLLNIYGQTEANSSTFHEVRDLPDGDAPIPAGRCFPNYDVFLLDEGGARITAPGVEGELYVAGGAVASGYFGDPDRTARVFVPHPLRAGVTQRVYRTGDRFCFDDRGELVFRGRGDSAVKVRGFRVEPAEVEAAAAACPGVQDAALVTLPDPATGAALVLFVTPAGDVELGADGVAQALAARLPPYMVPTVVLIERSLPRTSTGKLDRASLVEPATRAYGAHQGGRGSERP